MLVAWLKKTDYATEITNIKDDYVTNAALNARHKDLKKKKMLIRLLQIVLKC